MHMLYMYMYLKKLIIKQQFFLHCFKQKHQTTKQSLCSPNHSEKRKSNTSIATSYCSISFTNSSVLMEIPLIALISEFAASSSSNVILHHFLPSPRLWKWGALLLALIYAFHRLARIITKIILQLHGKAGELSSSSAPLLSGDDDDFFTSDGEDGDSVGSSCSSEDETEMPDDPASISCDNLAGFYENFVVKGSENSDDRSGRKRKFKMRRKRSLGGNVFLLGDVVNGKTVVKLWDGLGLGIGFDGSPSSSAVSILDLERSVKIGSLLGRIPAVSASSSAVVFAASAGCDEKVGPSPWDVRVRRRAPAAGPVVLLKRGGDEWVYVRDDVTGKGKVWDVRNAKSPLENVTEYDGPEKEGVGC